MYNHIYYNFIDNYTVDYTVLYKLSDERLFYRTQSPNEQYSYIAKVHDHSLKKSKLKITQRNFLFAQTARAMKGKAFCSLFNGKSK